MKLAQNPWKYWGFYGNPFDTRALSMVSELLPISRAFVGRPMDSPEAKQLLRIISNPGGGCGIVEGDIGVGKTTFVNYHRYLWENEAEDRLLTPVREISVYGKWTAKDFLKEILGHLAHKVLILLEQKKAKPNKFLKTIQFLNQVFYHESIEVEGSCFGFGVGYGSQAQLNIPDMTESQFIAYLIDLCDQIRKMGYKGIFLHFDNLELLNQQELQSCQYLFEEIRDILQLPYIYYIFVARTGFFNQIIASAERVRSIMGWPARIPPLTCQEVIEAINTRYRLLAIRPGSEVKPVMDTFIEKLYLLYGGKIRFIMDSIAQISLYSFGTEPHTLVDHESERILLDIVKLKTSGLSPKEYQVLEAIVQYEEFTNEDLSVVFAMKPPNVSKIIKRLSTENLIYYSRREGQRIYYRTIDELKVLWAFNQKTHGTPKKSIKMPLFISKAKDRLNALASYLENHEKITSKEYQQLMDVSASTARSDLGILIQQGMLKKLGDKRGTVYFKTNQ